MRATLVALIAFGATAVRGFGSIPQPASFSICNPDPDVLVWDTTPVPGELKRYVGWLKVPILHEQPSLERLEVPLGFTALRVSVLTKCAAGAKALLTVRASQCPGAGDEPSQNEIIQGGSKAGASTRMMNDPEAVAIFSELHYAAQSECRNYPEYDLGTNVARGHMVYQDFILVGDQLNSFNVIRVVGWRGWHANLGTRTDLGRIGTFAA